MPTDPPTAGVLFGAHAAPAAGQDTEQALVDLETRLGRRLDLHRMFRVWDDPLPDLVAARNVRTGRIPVVSWRPGTRNGGKIPWASIAAGHHDHRIRETADFLRCLPGPVIAVLHHEPDIALGYGDPADYRAAYARWRDLFDSRAADNVEHAVIITPAAFKRHAATADAVWPTSGVDWVGIDAYNWAGCAPGMPAHWTPLDQILRAFVDWATPKALPILIAEWGSAEDHIDPTRKAQWITEAFNWVRTQPQIRAMSWQHAPSAKPGCDWRADTTPQAWAAFHAAALDPYANTRS